MKSTSPLIEKEASLSRSLRELESVLVAYSGGVDSSLLAHYARRALGAKARVAIAVSPSLALEELAAARAQAEAMSWDLLEIKTDEVDNADYRRNDAMRCYICKGTLFETLTNLARSLDIKHIAYGANVDDLADFRPGHKAAREYGVHSPLQSAHLTKDDIRLLARQAGLPSWDRPQAACLSSRFPRLVPVTIDGLSQVERAESYLHSLGFRQVRVRHHEDLARIEIDLEDLPRLSIDTELKARVGSELRKIGYKQVALDLDGYRQGSANVPLTQSQGGRFEPL